MIRVIPFLLVLLLAAAPGCSSSSGATVDDEDPSVDADTAHADQVVAEVADVFYDMFSVFAQVSQIQCDCAHQYMGFSSSSDCHHEMTTPFDEAASPVSQCISLSAMDVAEPPPEDATDLLDCISDKLGEFNTCVEGVRSDATSACDESIVDDMDHCEYQMDRGFNECETSQSEATKRWFDALGDQADLNECFNHLPF